eukprot:5165028-Pleurochrysis_carterae.AAC.1
MSGERAGAAAVACAAKPNMRSSEACTRKRMGVTQATQSSRTTGAVGRGGAKLRKPGDRLRYMRVGA